VSVYSHLSRYIVSDGEEDGEEVAGKRRQHLDGFPPSEKPM
jgi:hypothetical protein